ncbi:hypothetical protein CL629_00900 [bacterium]|nr:hypothetical protein [bacterium]
MSTLAKTVLTDIRRLFAERIKEECAARDNLSNAQLSKLTGGAQCEYISPKTVGRIWTCEASNDSIRIACVALGLDFDKLWREYYRRAMGMEETGS